MQGARDSFAGVSFHCYEGSVGLQESFHSAYPDKVDPFLSFWPDGFLMVLFRKYTSRSALERSVATVAGH